jgi:hypothetical protein
LVHGFRAVSLSCWGGPTGENDSHHGGQEAEKGGREEEARTHPKRPAPFSRSPPTTQHFPIMPLDYESIKGLMY